MLNRDVDNFKLELTSAVDSILALELSISEVVSEKFMVETAALTTAVAAWNKMVEGLKDALETKKQNMYTVSAGVDRTMYGHCRQTLGDACNGLNNAIRGYNQAVNDRNKTMKYLLTLNKWVAYLENKSAFDYIRNLRERGKEINRRLEDIETALRNIDADLIRLNSGRANKENAMDFINGCLNMVFADNERLQLRESDDLNRYELTSRGEPLPPRNVSVGERNILALAYFFASLLENTAQENRYDVERFVVIDDPVSSFDKGNVLGVICLFSDMIEKLFAGKDDYGRDITKNKCKFLILSHDRQTVKYFEDIRDTVCEKLDTKELKNTGYEINIGKYYVWKSDYQELLTRILCFATENNYKEYLNEYKRVYSGIGNEIRQAFETFAKLNYNTDYPTMLHNKYTLIPQLNALTLFISS